MSVVFTFSHGPGGEQYRRPIGCIANCTYDCRFPSHAIANCKKAFQCIICNRFSGSITNWHLYVQYTFQECKFYKETEGSAITCFHIKLCMST